MSEDNLVEGEDDGNWEYGNTATDPLAKAQDGPSLLFSDDFDSANQSSLQPTNISTPLSTPLSSTDQSTPVQGMSTPPQTTASTLSPISTSTPVSDTSAGSSPKRLGDNAPFVKRSGSQLPIDGTAHPGSFFDSLFGMDTFEFIADRTNLYAR